MQLYNLLIELMDTGSAFLQDMGTGAQTWMTWKARPSMAGPKSSLDGSSLHEADAIWWILVVYLLHPLTDSFLVVPAVYA